MAHLRQCSAWLYAIVPQTAATHPLPAFTSPQRQRPRRALAIPHCQEYAMTRMKDGQYRWRSLQRLLFVAVLAASCAGNALAQLVIRQYTVSGTGSAIRNACYALSNTVGEAVAGPTNAGQYQLASGFWGARPTALQQNSIFSNGFEDCSP
jgi:hypothetical protein